MPSTKVPLRTKFQPEILLSAHIKLLSEVNKADDIAQTALADGASSVDTDALTADNFDFTSIQVTDFGSAAPPSRENYGQTPTYNFAVPDVDFWLYDSLYTASYRISHRTT